MSDYLLNEDDLLADPPLIDDLRPEEDGGGYAIGFIPSDDVSDSEKEAVYVHRDSIDGRRIAVFLAEIERLCGHGPLDHITHGGGGNYILAARDGNRVELSDGNLSQAVVQRIFDFLKQIAEAAEVAFRIAANRQAGRVMAQSA